MSFPRSMLQHLVTFNHRWLYSLFIAMDANFRLKLKTRDINDPELGDGLAYFVNTAMFEEHLKSHVEENEVSFSFVFRIENSRPKRSRPVEPSSMR